MTPFVSSSHYWMIPQLGSSSQYGINLGYINLALRRNFINFLP